MRTVLAIVAVLVFVGLTVFMPLTALAAEGGEAIPTVCLGSHCIVLPADGCGD